MLDKAAAMLVHFFCLKCIAGCWYCKINSLEPKVINHFRNYFSPKKERNHTEGLKYGLFCPNSIMALSFAAYKVSSFQET